MKKAILTLLIFTTLGLTAKADVITVSNNFESPGQYTSLQDAIDASSFNDTILVTGSSTSYGSATIKWPLTIIGAGYNNPYGENTMVAQLILTKYTESIGASCNIYGLNINYLNFAADFPGASEETIGILEDITIERCQIGYIDFGGDFVDVHLKNLQIQNCVLKNSVFQFSSSFYTNVFINNNICDNNEFSFTVGYESTLDQIIVSNNIFMNNTYDMGLSYGFDIPGIILKNNVFIGSNPSGFENSTFLNNITYMCANNELIHAGNPGSVGSGNIIGQNPQFVYYPSLGGPYVDGYDFHLQSSSPCIGAGVGGTDIGLYGGTKPFEQIGKNPNIPQMEWVEYPGSSGAPVGGTITLEFKTHTQD